MMLLCELFQDVILDSVLIPMVSGSGAAVEVPRYVFVLARPQAVQEGVRATPVQDDHREEVRRLFGVDTEAADFCWLSVRPYQKPHFKVDLAACRPEHLRLFDSKKGYLLHRGDIPPGAVIKGFGRPPLMGSR